MIETKFGKCAVMERRAVVADGGYKYVGFSWVAEVDPTYGKEEHGYLVYRKGTRLVAFRGYEPGADGID